MKCSIDGCERKRKYVKTGWCQTHYHRWWRTGDPLKVKNVHGAPRDGAPNWRGDDIKYRAAHARIVTQRGKASDHCCVECGSPAKQWAYTHNDPDELSEIVNGTECPFSVSPEYYQPMCRKCHRRYDITHQWEEN